MTDYTDNFERAWNVYPKRDGQRRGKAPAFKKWQALSADDKRAAFADIEKRNRYKLWGKYIVDMSRYLNERRWEDEVEVPQQQLFAPPEAKQPEVKLTWWEKLLGRLWFAYTVGTMRPVPEPDVKAALKIRSDVLRDVTPAFDEDIEAEVTSKRQAAIDVAKLFLAQLDDAYGRSDAERVLELASGQRWSS